MQNLDRPSHPEIPRWRRPVALPSSPKPAASPSPPPPSPPLIGDHWHATLDIWICGAKQPVLPEWVAGIHTHGDGIIHLHPFDPSEEGPGAAIGKFFEYGGGLLTGNQMRLPASNITHTNGDTCPGGSAAVINVQINGSPVADYAAYIPQDGDRILIYFGQIAMKGDVDCDDDFDAVDALKELRHIAGLPVSQESGCPAIGSEVASIFGDIDCDGDIMAVDALFILRFVVGLPVNLPQGCPPLGQ